MECLRRDVPERFGEIPDVVPHDLRQDVAVRIHALDGLLETGECRQPVLQVIAKHLLEFREAVESEDLGKPHDGRFADARLVCELCSREENRLLIVFHDVPRRFFLGVGQQNSFVGKQVLDRHETNPSLYECYEGIISVSRSFVKKKIKQRENDFPAVDLTGYKQRRAAHVWKSNTIYTTRACFIFSRLSGGLLRADRGSPRFFCTVHPGAKEFRPSDPEVHLASSSADCG